MLVFWECAGGSVVCGMAVGICRRLYGLTFGGGVDEARFRSWITSLSCRVVIFALGNGRR